MKILVVGSGGREHALCWAIGASPLCESLYCAPGNAGIAAEAECVPIAATDVDGLVGFARDHAIDLVVVGPEAPLVAGLVDRLQAAGIKAFGPSAAAAELEGSKGFMKDLCARHGVPTAAYRRFTDAAAAKAYIRQSQAPIVVKADGLAAGKGVVVAATVDDAEAAVDAFMMDRIHGTAGDEVIVEECLVGPEISFFALVDGAHALPLASAQDYKRVGDGNAGPNTGGMGAVSPAPAMDDALQERIMAEIVTPIVAGLAAEGRPYQGVLFAGLILTEDGPKALEFNVRFGDPECQALVVRLKSDLLPALMAAADGVLKTFDLQWYDAASVCVVMASRGYPGSYEKGTVIGGVEAAADPDGAVIFHAGTKRRDDGRIVADGGRVLGVTATGATIADARTQAYATVDQVDWPQGFCRRDIAQGL